MNTLWNSGVLSVLLLTHGNVCVVCLCGALLGVYIFACLFSESLHVVTSVCKCFWVRMKQHDTYVLLSFRAAEA